MAECMMPPLRSTQPLSPEAPVQQTEHDRCGSGSGKITGNAFDMSVLFDISKARWLNVSELCFLLDMDQTPLQITRHPPQTSPPSGTLILYNRSFTRNYKEDHYTWVKKRNSTKVREDHVKLRLGGKYRVAGCYVHCMTIATLHRRAYHLLHTAEDGTVIPNNNNGALKSPTSLVLVHYLDTQIASVFASTLAGGRNTSLMSLLPEQYKVQTRKPGSGRKSNSASSLSSQEKQNQKNGTTVVNMKDEYSSNSNAVVSLPPLDGYKNDISRAASKAEVSLPAFQQEFYVAPDQEGNSPTEEEPESPPLQEVATSASPSPSTNSNEEANDETTYDDEALDILWTMVMEEGGQEGSENVMQMLDNDAVGAMLESHASFGAMLEMGGKEKTNKQNLHERSVSEDLIGLLDDKEEEEDAKVSASNDSITSKNYYTTSTGGRYNGKSVHNYSNHEVEDTNSKRVAYHQQQHHPHKNCKSLAKPELTHSPTYPTQQPQRSHPQQYYHHQHQQSWNAAPSPSPRFDNSPAPNYQPQHNTSPPYDPQHNNQHYNYNHNAKWNNHPSKLSPPQNNSEQYTYPLTHHPTLAYQHMPYHAYLPSYTPTNISSSNASEPLHIPQELPPSTSPPPVFLENRTLQELPDIVDFTPEHAIMHNLHSNNSTTTKSNKVALSFSTPLPQKPDDGEKSTWHRIAVFAEIQITQEQTLIIGDMDLSIVTMLNPYSYRCNVPLSASKPGNRSIFITEVKLYKGIDPICEGILKFITEALQGVWDTAVSNHSASNKNPVKFYFSKKDENSSIRLLTQLSLSTFELEAPLVNHPSIPQQQNQNQQQNLQQHQHLHQQQQHQKQQHQQTVEDSTYFTTDFIKQLQQQQYGIVMNHTPNSSTIKNSYHSTNHESSIVVDPSTTSDFSRKRTMSKTFSTPLGTIAGTNALNNKSMSIISLDAETSQELISQDEMNLIDRHNRVRIIENMQKNAKIELNDSNHNKPKSSSQPNSPMSQPKLIQLLHVAEMNQNVPFRQQQ